jgi:hypothetical protein
MNSRHGCLGLLLPRVHRLPSCNTTRTAPSGFFKPQNPAPKTGEVKYIGTRQHSHMSSHAVTRRIFDDVEKRTRRDNEVVASRNNQLMRQLHNHCMSCCCHASHNILFYMHKLRNYISLPDDLRDDSLYMLFVESTQDYMSMHGTVYQTTLMYSPAG